MTRLVLGLTGYARSGKDTVGGFLEADHGFWRGAFAEGVREALLALDPRIPVGCDEDSLLSEIVREVGWDDAKAVPEVRRLLQRMGTEAGWRMHGDRLWVDRLLRTAPADRDLVITDLRFGHEAAAVRELGGFLVRVVRPGVGPVNGHVSETFTDELRADTVVRNDGTLEDMRAALPVVVTALRARAAGAGSRAREGW